MTGHRSNGERFVRMERLRRCLALTIATTALVSAAAAPALADDPQVDSAVRTTRVETVTATWGPYYAPRAAGVAKGTVQVTIRNPDENNRTGRATVTGSITDLT